MKDVFHLPMVGSYSSTKLKIQGLELIHLLSAHPKVSFILERHRFQPVALFSIYFEIFNKHTFLLQQTWKPGSEVKHTNFNIYIL